MCFRKREQRLTITISDNLLNKISREPKLATDVKVTLFHVFEKETVILIVSCVQNSNQQIADQTKYFRNYAHGATRLLNSGLGINYLSM